MDLPCLADLNEFNRILLIARHLSNGDRGCSLVLVKHMASLKALGGRIVKHTQSIALCVVAGLLRTDGGRLAVSSKGSEFLQHNQQEQYELTQGQQEFIVRQVMFGDPWKSAFRNLFSNFSPNYNAITYELELLNVPQVGRTAHAIRLMSQLGVLTQSDGYLRVIPDFVADVRALLSSGSILDESALELALTANRKLGEQAELAVVDFEKKRLCLGGCNLEARLVRRISLLNASAGYDIESFNGQTNSGKHDRFIEVKASVGKDIRFFLTNNELQVARSRGKNYWIYFMPEFIGAGREGICPVMINDPARKIFKARMLSAIPWTYQIRSNVKTRIQSAQCGSRDYYVL
jgi:hypothetical protein